MRTYDLIVIGGGPAGMAAALSAAKHQVKNILIIILRTSLCATEPSALWKYV